MDKSSQKKKNKYLLMSLKQEIQQKLTVKGADFVKFVSLSQLHAVQTKGFSVAVIFGIALSAEYLQYISKIQDYVQNMIENKQVGQDEFYLKERQTDQMADELENLLIQKEYAAYSQSEDHVYLTGFYNSETKSTPLPHKTIAGLAGLGWIGKHNLLVTPEYGSAISMCTVLTDAPLPVEGNVLQEPQCGSCQICQFVCPPNAIKGNNWSQFISRDDLVNVYQCTTCLRCMVMCPYTQKYIQKSNVNS